MNNKEEFKINYKDEKEIRAEYDKIIEWEISERKKISDELHKKGKGVGLDTNMDVYKTVIEERERRIKELFNKYRVKE